MLKRSAGIIIYKYDNNELKILLCHFGGPYWVDVERSWSLSKGVVEKGEKTLLAAKREFKEETNLDFDGDLKYLWSKKISNKKLAVMFYSEGDYDLSNCKSNTFEMEYPKGSGKKCKFPEMDSYKWVNIIEARKFLIPSQLCFLDKLEEKSNERSS